MRKRTITLLLALIVCLSFSSCLPTVTVKESNIDYKNNTSSNSVKIDKSESESKVTVSPYYDPITITNGYDTLDTDCQRLCYNEIYNHITDFTSEKKNGLYILDTFTVYDCTLTKRELAKVFTAFFEDNPQIFWLEETYAFAIYDDSVDIRLYATMSKQQYTKCQGRLNAVVSDILSSLKKNLSDVELELYFHDYIVNNCKYKNNVSTDRNSAPFTVYGALINQKAVCRGYTKAFQMLLAYVGINSVNINGFGSSQEHVWSAVSIENQWYYVDVTWDDTSEISMYDYFNVTTSQIKKNHTINPLYENCSDLEVVGNDDNAPINFNIFVPKCKSTKYNYYVYYGCVLSNDSYSTLTDALIKSANNHDNYFYIYVNPDNMDFKTAYDSLFSGDYAFSTYINEANAEISENKLSTSVSVLKKKNRNTIVVELEYI